MNSAYITPDRDAEIIGYAKRDATRLQQSGPISIEQARIYASLYFLLDADWPSNQDRIASVYQAAYNDAKA